MSSRPPKPQASLTSVQAAFCLKITKKMMNYTIARFFREPVDPDRDQAYDYFDRIKKPMDLGTVLQNLQDDKYQTVEKWKDDMNLIWKNAMTYNGPGSPLNAIARDLSEIFRQKSEVVPMTQTEEWLLSLRRRHQKVVRIFEAKPEGASSCSIMQPPPKPTGTAKGSVPPKIVLRSGKG